MPDQPRRQRDKVDLRRQTTQVTALRFLGVRAARVDLRRQTRSTSSPLDRTADNHVADKIDKAAVGAARWV